MNEKENADKIDTEQKEEIKMLSKKVNIDKNELPSILVQCAHKLNVNYWGNLFQVLEKLTSTLNDTNAKLKILYREISIKEIQQYGALIDAEEKFVNSDNYVRDDNVTEE